MPEAKGFLRASPVNATIEVVGIRRVVGWMERLPLEAQDEMHRGFEEAGETIRARAAALAPVGVTGRTRQSIRVRRMRARQAGTGGTLGFIVGPTVRHRHLVIRGRRPGKMPPPERLRAWAEFRGLHGKEFVLARAIGANGTVGRPFMGQAMTETGTAVRDRIREAVRRALRIVGTGTD
jgi:hypothetical protein